MLYLTLMLNYVMSQLQTAIRAHRPKSVRLVKKIIRSLKMELFAKVLILLKIQLYVMRSSPILLMTMELIVLNVWKKIAHNI